MYERELALRPGRRARRRRRRQLRRVRGAALMLAVLLALPLARLALGGARKEAGDGASAAALAAPAQSAAPEGPALPQAEEPVLPPEGDAGEDWRLTLVNPWNPLPDGYAITRKELSNGLEVDERCYDALQEMMDACRGAGLSPVICSAYRSQQTQSDLFQSKVDRLLAQGLDAETAVSEAGKVVAAPGTSEHQLGLAMDIVDLSNQNLDESQEDTAVQQWLMEHSWEYGFILRYPGGKSALTGIIYEPWHYRYVGAEAAREIHEQGVCLEEYLKAR